MRAWYVPTWNGDLRMVPDRYYPRHTIITVVKPTPHETQTLKAIREAFVDKGWVEEAGWPAKFNKWRNTKITVSAPLSEIGPVVSTMMRPGKAVLTAITLKDGECLTVSAAPGEISQETAKRVQAIVEKAEEVAEVEPAKEPVAAATVRRATPSCPQCFPGAIEPATEVLLSFLSPTEHADWARDRALLVTGGVSQHRYLLAHRHSETARRIGRVCYDLTDGGVMHFHDRSVPPEEEVLAALLILRHREEWLRNEATCLGRTRNVSRWTNVFKNPFGDGGDGTETAGMLSALGALGAGLGGKGGAG